MKLIAVVAVVSVAGEAGRRHHSLGCRRGEEVDHPMLCCKVQLQRVQALQELGGFAGKAFEELAWISHNHLKTPMCSFKERTRMCCGPILKMYKNLCSKSTMASL